jgi:predicted alpha-1,6-mannanase (GH76 family)
MDRIRRAAALSVFLAASPLAAQTSEEYHRRADAALESFLLKFWSQSHSYLRASWPDDGRRTGYWTFAQGFDALLDGVEPTGGRKYAGLVETFYRAQQARGWLVGHYDDESWMALALMRAFDLTGDARYLQTARTLFEDIMSGWDETCCGPRRGGIWWDKARTQKATASNAGPVIAGARLAERTGTSSYLDFAVRAYEFWLEYMTIASTGQVIDHINPDGTKVYWKFTYNEGLMVGASVELHRITGDPRYLTLAHRFAGYMLANETTSTAYGSVLHDGSNTSCGGDCHMFKGPAARYLKLLHDAAGTLSYAITLKACADAIWNLARSPEETLFSVSWAGPRMTAFSEPQVCAAVMALNLVASMRGPYPGAGSASLRYEAEDATISGLKLEALYGSFTGWGYVAGWNGNGQRVGFRVEPPTAGEYEIVFRHAAGAGDAHRLVRIDGRTAEARLLFPATGSWSEYASASVRSALPGGAVSIAVVLDAASGSANFLNLDHLLLRPLFPYFARGDANADGGLDLSDAIAILLRLFGSRGDLVPCEQAADVDADGEVGIADAVGLLHHIFRESPPPPAPHPGCGAAPPEDRLTCASFPPCEG